MGGTGGSFFINTLPNYIIGGIFIGINIGLFIFNFHNYFVNEKFKDTLKVLHFVGLPLARGAALPLNFSCGVILLPVCRNLLSFVRGSINGKAARMLDENIAFHILVGWTIVVLTISHVIGHVLNVNSLSSFDVDINGNCINAKNLESQATISPIDDSVYPVKNFPDYCGKGGIIIALTLVPGVTGIVMIICLFLMVTTALTTVRRKHFELFWYTHHLFIIFFACLIGHGLSGVVKSSSARPTGGKIYIAGTPMTWMFVGPSLLLYLIERLVRAGRAVWRKIEIVKIVQHPSKVFEVMMKGSITTEAGQYIFVNVPSVAKFEWHPFTLTSCPEEDFISVHIRVAGDWTECVAKALGCDWSKNNDGGKPIQLASTLPRINVDGPLGTPSVDIVKYKTAIMVGAGIGVTPMASLLKSIWFRIKRGEDLKLQKIYFVWTARDKACFEWFASLLDALETEMAQKGFHEFLNTSIFLTGKLGIDDTNAVVLNDEESHDMFSGLQAKTNFGRPHWDRIFEDVARANAGTSIGVFLCGPAVIAHSLAKMSKKHTVSGGTRFFFNAEHF